VPPGAYTRDVVERDHAEVRLSTEEEGASRGLDELAAQEGAPPDDVLMLTSREGGDHGSETASKDVRRAVTADIRRAA
jgi:hypothetical protein